MGTGRTQSSLCERHTDSGVYCLTSWLAGITEMAELVYTALGIWLFFSMVVLTTASIGILKSQSAHACPWDMTIPTHNGILWDFSATAGHCFPGGHASSGFALMAGYFVYRISNRKRAYFLLIGAVILGLAMGWAQMMRGAHFLSHNLWTGWIIWCINVIGYTLFSHKLPIEKTTPIRSSIRQP